MQFKKLNRTGADNVYIQVKNGEAYLVNGGTPVSFDYTTDKDGNTVIQPTTAMLHAFAGVVKDGEVLGTSGQDDQYGLVQVYGKHPGVYMAGTTVHPGAMMVPVDSKSYVTLATTFAHADSTAEAVTFNQDLAFVTAGTTACVEATSTFGSTYIGMIRAL